jgi:hypothetical protein
VTSYLTMYDAVDIGQIPSNPAAVAGYVDGAWQTAHALAARFPHARLLTIAVFAADDADCLDIETGDATPAQAAAWYARQKTRGVQRPCLYASVELMQAQVIPVLKAAGISRGDVRLWAAHYSGRHICGPASCGELGIDADGCQFTDAAFGRNLDQSMLLPDFFTVTPAPVPQPAPAPLPAPSPNWLEAAVRELPVLQQGASGEDVRTIQGLLIARGHQVAVDGAFGPATHEAIVAFQQSAQLGADGIVGQQTWPKLLGV